MIRRPPRSTLFPYTTLLPISSVQSLFLVRLPDPNVPPQQLSSCLCQSCQVPVCRWQSFWQRLVLVVDVLDRKSTRLNSSHANISYAVFCLKKNIIILVQTVLT